MFIVFQESHLTGRSLTVWFNVCKKLALAEWFQFSVCRTSPWKVQVLLQQFVTVRFQSFVTDEAEGNSSETSFLNLFLVSCRTPGKSKDKILERAIFRPGWYHYNTTSSPVLGVFVTKNANFMLFLTFFRSLFSCTGCFLLFCRPANLFYCLWYGKKNKASRFSDFSLLTFLSSCHWGFCFFLWSKQSESVLVTLRCNKILTGDDRNFN